MKPERKKTRDTRRSVVIVDDEEAYVEMMAQMMATHLDCSVHAFTRPREALGSLSRVSVGVVVTDYSMPEMDGVEFIRKASRIAPEAAFIMISGNDLDPIGHELARLKRLKMRLNKPCGWRRVVAAVLKVWPGDDTPGFRPHAAGHT